MKKMKKYVSPEMNVVNLEVAPLLCGSGTDSTVNSDSSIEDGNTDNIPNWF